MPALRPASRAVALLSILSGLSVLSLGPQQARADSVPAALAQRYAELAQRAEAAFAQAGPGAAIHVYESGAGALGGDYGRLHLRLGQLYQQLGQATDAAHHFVACAADTRVEAIDRDFICEDALKSLTARVTLDGLPDDGTALVLDPPAFAGPFQSGQRLPLGGARLAIEAPGHARQESDLRVALPETRFSVVLGPAVADAESEEGRTAPPQPEPGFRHWGSLGTAGAGVALLGAGLALGFLNRGALSDIRDRQARGACGAGHCRGELSDASTQAEVADGLWIGGAGLTLVGAGLFLWME